VVPWVPWVPPENRLKIKDWGVCVIAWNRGTREDLPSGSTRFHAPVCLENGKQRKNFTVKAPVPWFLSDYAKQRKNSVFCGLLSAPFRSCAPPSPLPQMLPARFSLFTASFPGRREFVKTGAGVLLPAAALTLSPEFATKFGSYLVPSPSGPGLFPGLLPRPLSQYSMRFSTEWVKSGVEKRVVLREKPGRLPPCYGANRGLKAMPPPPHGRGHGLAQCGSAPRAQAPGAASLM
jgi:hypothetical protein